MTSSPPSTTYRPGGWLAVVAPGLALLADLRPGAPLTGECWALVRDGDFDGLVAALNGSMFAAVRHHDGDAEILVCGAAGAEVVDVDGQMSAVRSDVAGRSRSTSVASVRLTGTAAGHPGTDLPLVGGQVLAAELTVRLAPVQQPPIHTSRYDAMFGRPATEAVQPLVPVAAKLPVEAPPTAPIALVAEPDGHTVLRPVDQAAPDGGFMDLTTMSWLAGAPEQPMPNALPVPPFRPESRVAPYEPLAVAADEDALVLTTVRGVSGPTVEAIVCVARHLNAPEANTCRVCGAPIRATERLRVTRPVLGVLRLPSGDTISLDRNVVLGRAPGTPAGTGADEPHYVKLPGTYRNISRRHVEFRIDGWDVVAADLGSRNGSVVEQPGQAPVELSSGASCVLHNGATVDLAGDLIVRYEVTG